MLFNERDLQLKFGLDAEKFLAKWAVENSEELVESLEELYADDEISDKEKVRAIYLKTLNFIFAALSEAITENNRVIEKQLRRSGVNLPFFDN